MLQASEAAFVAKRIDPVPSFGEAGKALVFIADASL